MQRGAAEKLRRHGVAAAHGFVFMHSNKFNGDRPIYAAKPISLLEATQDTHELVAAALHAGSCAWKDGYRYAKAGLVLTDLVAASSIQQSFFRHGQPALRARLALPGRHGHQARMVDQIRDEIAKIHDQVSRDPHCHVGTAIAIFDR